ncbi:MAG: peptidase C1A papain, partial [Chitinophagaceae bacterium]|nr:peptidase C1A papain [Chitinophagaceae bacterium]
FKMEVKNSTECYIYVFGKETDGTSYTLFPYPRADDPSKTKYSPFCGITGYRVFPKDKSMTADSVGKRDAIAVVVSKDEIDWVELNAAISRNPQTEFSQRLNAALGLNARAAGRSQVSSTGNIVLRAGNGGKVLACVVEIDKQ